jgi:hypothetical protein
MTNEQIEKLDYFDKAQLYHTVYYNKTYILIIYSFMMFILRCIILSILDMI